MTHAVRSLLSVLATMALTNSLSAGDWPMWRHNPARTAVAPDALPEDLHLQWTLALPAARPAWPESQPKLRFDASYEPVVAGGRMFVGSTVNDSLTAYDAKTGRRLWRFYTDGPVRFAPAVANGRLYAVSDDGHLYCLDAASGELVWKVNGGPAEQRILGNDRLISMWPARGGVVVAEGTAYFTASIWPSMGIFIHAVDAESGQILWTNSETGGQFTVHPHGAPSFGSIVPQGYLAVSGERLFVPGGRSLPAVFDRQTGDLLHFQFGGKSSGGYAVTVGERFYSVAEEQFRLEDGTKIGSYAAALVDGATIIEAQRGSGVIEVRRFGEKVTEKK
ncbi:MAG: PQQ-binding-like beta-propeller repeat protein, partial [Planctomycetaceae bacterium]